MRAKKEKGHAHWGSLVFLLALMGVTGFMLFRDESIHSLLPAIRQVNPWYVALGLLMMFLFVGCESLCKYLTLRALGQKVLFRRCMDYSFVGFYVSSITPSSSGGQPAQMYYMSKDKISLSHSSLTMLVITIVYQAVMLLYGLVMYLLERSFVQESIGSIKYLLLFGVVVNLALIALFVMVIFSRRALERLLEGGLRLLHRLHLVKDVAEKRQAIAHQMAEYARGARYIRQNPALVLRVVAVTVVQMTALYLVPFFVYKAFGLSSFTVLQILAVQSLLTIAVSSLPLPGAVGATESGFMTLFKVFFSANLLMPAMVLSRGISFYAFLLISGIATLAVHLRCSRGERRLSASGRRPAVG